MAKNKLIIGVVATAVVGFFAYNQFASSPAPMVKAPANQPAINAPVSKVHPEAFAQKQAPQPSKQMAQTEITSAESVNHASHSVPMPPEGVSRDQYGKDTQSLPHGHERVSDRGERRPPGEPKKENSAPTPPPNAPVG